MRITKDEYILKSFSKLRNKKWELYVITRIIHLLNDPEIDFVCQQPIKSKDGNRYLTDLCFPGLKLYCEIDESHHANEENLYADISREKEIIIATGFEEKRIRVFDKNGNDRQLNDINDEIDQFIEFIRQTKKVLLSKREFEPWNYEKKFDPNFHIERGDIDINNNVTLLRHEDVLRCFGYEKGQYQRATWKIPGTNKTVWFPKLYENNDWINTLSEDGEKISMKKTDNSMIEKTEEWFPIVFAHYRDSLGQVYYKFMGEFKLSLNESNDLEHIFLRTNTRIYLNNL